MLEHKWSRSMALLATLVCMLVALSNVSAAHAASVSKKSFAVKGGIISGLLVPIVAPRQVQTTQTASTQSSSPTSGLLDPSGIQYFAVMGQLVGTRYSYPLQFTANPGQKIGLVEISNNLTTHTQVIAVGTPTNRLLNPDMQQATPPMQQGTAQGQAQNKAASVVPFTSSASRSFTTSWYDPVNINVNWVKDTINFSYNGTNVTGFSGSDSRWWLGDGWFEASHYIGSGYTGGGSDPYSQAAVYTGDTIQNNTFCALQSTYVYYSNNAVLANGNGSTFGNIDTWAAGGCSSWLHYGTALG